MSSFDECNDSFEQEELFLTTSLSGFEKNSALFKAYREFVLNFNQMQQQLQGNIDQLDQKLSVFNDQLARSAQQHAELTSSLHQLNDKVILQQKLLAVEDALRVSEIDRMATKADLAEKIRMFESIGFSIHATG